MYKVVEFTETHQMAVIPENWLDGTSCSVWPGYDKDQRNVKAAKMMEPPTTLWKSYPIRVMYQTGKYYFVCVGLLLGHNNDT